MSRGSGIGPRGAGWGVPRAVGLGLGLETGATAAARVWLRLADASDGSARRRRLGSMTASGSDEGPGSSDGIGSDDAMPPMHGLVELSSRRDRESRRQGDRQARSPCRRSRASAPAGTTAADHAGSAPRSSASWRSRRRSTRPARPSRSSSGSSSPSARPAAGRTSSGQWTRYSENEIRPRNRSGARSPGRVRPRVPQPGEDDGGRTRSSAGGPDARIRRRRVDDEERGDDHAETEQASRGEQPARGRPTASRPDRTGRGDGEQATEAELPGPRGQREERPRLRDVGEDDRAAERRRDHDDQGDAGTEARPAEPRVDEDEQRRPEQIELLLDRRATSSGGPATGRCRPRSSRSAWTANRMLPTNSGRGRDVERRRARCRAAAA